MTDNDMCSNEELKQEMQSLRKDLKPVLEALERNNFLLQINSNTEKVDEIYAFIFEEEGLEDRKVIDDLKLFRDLYNKVSGFSSIVGFVIGVLVVVIPMIIGIIRLIVFLVEYFSK